MFEEDITKEEKARQKELIRKAFREVPELAAMVEKFRKELEEEKKKREA